MGAADALSFGRPEIPFKPPENAFAFYRAGAETIAMTTLSNAVPGPSPFLGRAYDETMGLLLSARHYCAAVQPRETAPSDPQDRLHLNCEAMRLTTRLAQVMAWLLAQRAVAVGELSAEKARTPDYRLGAHDICLADTTARVNELSPRLADLMARSLNLFERIARLDSQFDAHA
jgi:regulator of CtrA degradation